MSLICLQPLISHNPCVALLTTLVELTRQHPTLWLCVSQCCQPINYFRTTLPFESRGWYSAVLKASEEAGSVELQFPLTPAPPQSCTTGSLLLLC